MLKFIKITSKQTSSVIIIALIFILLINLLFVIFRASAGYNEAASEGNREVSQITNMTSDHIEIILLASDMTLKRVQQKQYVNELFGNTIYLDVQNSLKMWSEEIPQIAALMVINEEGLVKSFFEKTGDEIGLKYNASVAKYPFFSNHVESYENKLEIFLYEAGGKVYFVLSRESIGVDGSFNGVVATFVDASYIFDFFKSIDSSFESKKIHLMRKNTNALISTIENPNIIKQTKHLFEKGGLAKAIANPFAIEEGVIALQNIESIGVDVAIFVDDGDIYSEWRENRMLDILFFLIFALFAAIIGLFALILNRKTEEAKKAELGAIAASQSKSEFLANMSHELRTPLNAIIGFSDMLKGRFFGDINEKQEERIIDINDSGHHLLSLVTDILEFSKGEAGKLDIQESIVDLNDIVHESLGSFTNNDSKDKARIIDEIEPDLPKVKVDSRRIKQVLINLISNADKYTPSEGIIKLDIYRRENGKIRIMVSDTGIGMDEADIPKALSTFGQVHSELAKGGTGLGLPMCKVFVELHGSELKIKSSKGEGTRVYFDLNKDRIRT